MLSKYGESLNEESCEFCRRKMSKCGSAVSPRTENSQHCRLTVSSGWLSLLLTVTPMHGIWRNNIRIEIWRNFRFGERLHHIGHVCPFQDNCDEILRRVRNASKRKEQKRKKPKAAKQALQFMQKATQSAGKQLSVFRQNSRAEEHQKLLWFVCSHKYMYDNF